MKRNIVIAAAIVAVISTFAFAKTVGVTYTDALVIPYNGTQTAGITAAGAISGTSIALTGPTTIYSRTKAQIDAQSAGYTAGQMVYCSDCVARMVICTAASTCVSVSTGTFQ